MLVLDERSGAGLSIDFEKLFNAMSTPHMVLDREFRYVAANPAYEAAVMRGIDELRGVNLFDAFPNSGESGRRLRASFQRVLETGQEDVIAYIPYDIPRPAAKGGGMERRFWTATHAPMFDDAGEVVYILQNTVDVTELVRLKEAAAMPLGVRGEGALIERARRADQAREALLTQAEDFRRLFQQAPGFMAVLTGSDHVFTFANDGYLKLVGGRNVVGLPVREALPEVEGQGFFELLDAVYTTGREHGAEGARVMLREQGDGALSERFLDFSYKPVRDAEGKVGGVFVQGMDRTESFKAARAQRLLVDELNHRVRNTLATVQSIASQTLRAAPDIESARKAFEARIVALAKAHTMLSERNWSNADLETVVRREMAAHGNDRVAIAGPHVTLSPKAAIAMAMVIHELGTNAARHGALADRAGKVDVSWRLEGASTDGEPNLAVKWRETGVPAEEPARNGFGTRVIDRAVTGELGGSIDRKFGPDGFACSLTFPFSAYGRNDDAFSE